MQKPPIARAGLVALALLTVTLAPPGVAAQQDPAAARVVGAPSPEAAAAAAAAPSGDGEREPRSRRPRRRTQRLHFAEGARPVGLGDYGTTAAYVGALLAMRAVEEPETPRWTRVNGFDGFMRDGLRLGSGGRDAIATASDALLFTLAAYPVLVDDLALVLVGDRNPGLAARLVAIDAQAYALMSLVMGLTKLGAARERPYARAVDCEAQPNAPECSQRDRNMSFFSGHASMAFTGAGLACFHQQQVEGLYGGRGAGLAVCGSAMALATSTALFRVMADKHWMSDVLVGAGVGLFSGWLLPWLTHGRTFLDFEGEHVSGSVSPTVDRTSLGVTVRGSF